MKKLYAAAVAALLALAFGAPSAQAAPQQQTRVDVSHKQQLTEVAWRRHYRRHHRRHYRR